MAEIVVSALLQVIFQNLATEAVKKVRSKRIISKLKILERTLIQIQALLNDASQKEITNVAVRSWLASLQHLAYDIDDMLDGLATDAMHRELTKGSGSLTTKVKRLMAPTFFTNFKLNNKLYRKLEDITTNLQDLENKTSLIGLIESNERPQNINRKLQTSLVDVPSIVGRQGEKESLVRKLLGDEPSDQNFSIVPIVGMGGVGKTTLARILYDEQQVKDHFELMAWVCVSDDFDSFHISKVIFQSVGGENKEEFADLNLLQVALRDRLMNRRFLLVLDDVWSESYEDWDTLVGPFHACASGSKIIMTTRKEQLVKKLCSGKLNHLHILSHDDALCLFQHALGVNNFDSHPTLKPYGEGIVKKCDGLPLALIAIGRLLRTKKDEEEYWKEVLNSEIWRLQDVTEINPALRLSYLDLSAHLKQVFTYCSLFSKDYVFNKDNLVLLWMAEGFLHHSYSSNQTEEQLGRKYFDELLSRSFFQHAPNNKSLYVMHDLMNELATSFAGDFFLRLEDGTDNDIRKESLEKYRYLSLVRKQYESYKKFEAFQKAKRLRTFFTASVGVNESLQKFYLSKSIVVDLLSELPLLRVLCLNGYEINEVPESIGSLRHLRYLNLSQTKITHLPENVGNLYNLQTLILCGCQYLMKLPNSFEKLKNLRHLDIWDTPLLTKIPFGISELINVQTLSKIVIGGENKFEITEIKDLKNLCGIISVKGLDKVKNVVHAREVKFLEKKFSELELEWSDVFDGSRKETHEKEVLNELKPHNDTLKKLTIVSYGGLELPDWVGDPSFHRLKHVSISGCKKCTHLPSLGQIQSLEELFYQGMDGVRDVGLELLGSGVAFRSLEILSFKDMKGWKEWSTNNNGDVFPCLKKLYMEDCPNLDVISVEALPSLRFLKIRACGNGVLRSLVQIASQVTQLEIESISGLTDDVWGGVTEYLGTVEELRIESCNEIRYLWESQSKASKDLVNLKSLKIQSCEKLVSLGEEDLEEEDNSGMTSLRMLEIQHCRNMECCGCPNRIETLKIFYCNSMTTICFPKGGGGGQNLKSLWIGGCCNLLENEFGGGPNSTSTPSLKHVDISDWVNLKSIIDLNCYLHLTNLLIRNCSSLESFPDHQLSHLTSLKQLVIRDCPSMDASFPSSSGLVWPPNLQYLAIGALKKPILNWVPQNFPTSLVNLTLYGGYPGEEEDVMDISKISHLMPSSLTSLCMYDFKKLESVAMGLQHLTSLQHLSIWWCPYLMDLPEMLLPQLLSLTIGCCRKLKEMCSSKTGKGSRISHIPKIEIKG